MPATAPRAGALSGNRYGNSPDVSSQRDIESDRHRDLDLPGLRHAFECVSSLLGDVNLDAFGAEQRVAAEQRALLEYERQTDTIAEPSVIRRFF
jgi:hypothetical protein